MGAGGGTALVIGPGPVTLSQGPSFQYLAARGCALLRRRGLRVLALEDNPATLMDAAGDEGALFIEPPAVEVVRRIAERYGVDSAWHGWGGCRGRRLYMSMAGDGWYEAAGIRTPDLDDRTLWLCGDRSLLREALEAGGMANPPFQAVGSLRDGQAAAERLGFPLVVRPHFSCGGAGAGLAYNLEDYPVLLEEAMRESPTGEVLVEKALGGWRKYVAVVLRDAGGASCVPGVFEQQDPLPLHDEDAVLTYPPWRCGRDGEYALQETARQVARLLDLRGLVEVKLAAPPAWESVFVLDVNPGPWRVTALLEAARGTDLLAAHVDLLSGAQLAPELLELGRGRPAATLVAVPRRSFEQEREGEGPISLACTSTGRGFFVAASPARAAARAAASLRGMARGNGQALRVLEEMALGLRAGGGDRGAAPPPAGGRAPHRLAHPRGEDGEGGVLLLGADNAGPSGGYEANVNCLQAVRACRREGRRVALYTPDPGFALLAARDADAVWVGMLRGEEAAAAAEASRTGSVVAHYGGRAAAEVAMQLADGGLEVWALSSLREGHRMEAALRRLREAGLQVVDFVLGGGAEGAEEIARRNGYPVMAMADEPGAAPMRKLVYGAEDARAFAHSRGSGEVLWRAIREEAQEIQAEAVAGGEESAVLLWEQVDAPGINSSDGLAVYPPRYLTKEQSQRARELAGRALQALGWGGNLSLRMHITGGELYLWSISVGASANLPFLARASSLQLAAMGMASLCGGSFAAGEGRAPLSAVRVPTLPYGLIAASDILASPQRRSTGAVMGIAADPGVAVAKALWSQGLRPQPGGKAFLSVANREKRRAPMLARELLEAGYLLMATRGTAHALEAAGIRVETVNKLREGRPNILDLIRNGQIGLIVNVPRGKHPHSDGFYIRAASARHGIPCVTNMEVALALARGMRRADPRAWEVSPLGARGPRPEGGGD